MLRALVLAISAYIIIDIFFEVISKNKTIVYKRLKSIKNINKPRIIDEDVMSLSFQDRIVKPIIENFIKTVAMLLPIKEESQKELAYKLSQAGIKMNPKDYRAMNIIIIVSLGALGSLYGLKTHSNVFQIALFFIIGVFAGYVYRRYSLEGKVTQRKAEIKSQLPEVMDILSVSVVAGLSFDQALGYVVERSQGAVIEEFGIAQREITLGSPRKEALSGLAARCQVDELKSFTNAIIQADELGISMQNILNSQSKMIRDAHRQEIEEKAAKIPVKILIPMVLFIFPVIFIILLGPAVPQIMEALGGM